MVNDIRQYFQKSWFGLRKSKVCRLTMASVFSGLGLLVNWLSDPDNLNQLVVNQLGSVALKSPAEEQPASDPDQDSLASQEGGEGGKMWVAVICTPRWLDQVLWNTRSTRCACLKLDLTWISLYFLYVNLGACQEQGIHQVLMSEVKGEVGLINYSLLSSVQILRFLIQKFMED